MKAADDTRIMTLTICNQRGLHARAAAKFVKCAGQFRAEITVARDGTRVSGQSIMGLMMLAAGLGSEIEISASGPDSEQALAAIRALVECGFEEGAAEAR
ncbi:MAG: HPr family phosphocarrier protein [Alphaproteobacteria bacterium]|nr:HPr family phosphocarrier protein [Alphaproteobacteria bacterium]MCW5751847.1 HPr family phosphocarrier protein [Alphaproteobacteria bacterium]